MQATYERTTKIERMKKSDGELVHLGDLVYCAWTSSLPGGSAREGEVVGFARGKAVIDLGERFSAEHGQRFSHIYVNHLDVIVCVKG